MIIHLKGKIEEIFENSIDLDVDGVGYSVLCSTRLCARCKVGDEIKVYTELIIREDAWVLFGFSDLQEKYWFKLLTSVQGVGGKAAIAILSALSIEELYNVFLSSDAKMLSRAPGVGPKLAGRIISELKEKVAGKIELPSVGIVKNGVVEDVVSALINLGYYKADIINEISKEKVDSNTKFDILLRRVLNKLSSRE